MLRFRQVSCPIVPLFFAGKGRPPEALPPLESLIGKRVEVYYNLHKKCLTLRSMDNPHRGKVLGYADSVLMKDAVFIVQKAGRERVLKEKRKNVHAFVRGILQAINTQCRLHPKDVEAVTYNPYKHDSFVKVCSEIPVSAADQVLVTGKKIQARQLKEKSTNSTHQEARKNG